MPTLASTSGYRTEIGALQCRHLPRSSNQDTSGMLSYQEMGAAHTGHLERGRTSDSLWGSLTMQTLRKLPTIRPARAASARTNCSDSTLRLEANDPGGHRHVERLGTPGQRDRDPGRRQVRDGRAN